MSSVWANRILICAAAIGLGAATAAPARGQYSAIATPFHQVGSSYSEQFGVNFGFNLPGGSVGGNSSVVGLNPLGQLAPGGQIQFQQGGAGAARPPFGGQNPGGGGQLGFAVQGGGANLFFNFAGEQASSTSLVSETPVLVVPNGGTGTLINATQRPFVIGFEPVVGGWPNLPPAAAAQPVYASPLQERLDRLRRGESVPGAARTSRRDPSARDPRQPASDLSAARADHASGRSTAEQGDVSLDEIRGALADETRRREADALALLERAREAAAAGKSGVARIYLRLASRQADGELRERVLQQLQALDETAPAASHP